MHRCMHAKIQYMHACICACTCFCAQNKFRCACICACQIESTCMTFACIGPFKIHARDTSKHHVTRWAKRCSSISQLLHPHNRVLLLVRCHTVPIYISMYHDYELYGNRAYVQSVQWTTKTLRSTGKTYSKLHLCMHLYKWHADWHA